MTECATAIPDALLVDLDGVVCNGRSLCAGVIEAVEIFQELGVEVRYLTNDAWNSRWGRAGKLRSLGLEVEPDSVFTASTVAAGLLQTRSPSGVLLLTAGSAGDEFRELPMVSHSADVVVVGDLTGGVEVNRLQEAYRCLINGAEFIALQYNRYYMTDSGPHIDAGFFVAGLAYCASREPVLVGKPSIFSYEAALASTGAMPERSVMVGDNAEVDLIGAAAAGLGTVLIETWGRRESEDGEIPEGTLRFPSLLLYARHLMELEHGYSR